MDLLADLEKPEIWEEYYVYKCNKQHWNKREEAEWKDYIERRGYESLMDNIRTQGYCFSVPEKKRINKFGSDKKRVVYSFHEDENRVLKVMAWLFYRYDACMPSNLYSFRKDFGAKKAIRSILKTKNLNEKYCYKVDIHDYFNQIQISILLPIIERILGEDKKLLSFLIQLLTTNESVEDGMLITEQRGAMAGTPIASFFANIYLMELDAHFENLGVLYARYSDDIILFADSMEELNQYQKDIVEFIHGRGLSINREKEVVSLPGSTWEFLGISYQNGQTDLSLASKQKMMGKIKRKAKAIYRWKCKKHASNEDAIRVLIRVFDRKYFENPRHSELTWTRWFFPLLTTDKGLQELDRFFQEKLRFVATGKYNKANLKKIPYESLKACGYRSLVHEYYIQREKENEI